MMLRRKLDIVSVAFGFLLGVFLATNAALAQSQQGNEVRVRVGNPPVQSSQGLSSVLDWDRQIVTSLGRGLWGYFNVLTTSITNGAYNTGTWAGTNKGTVYWCTYSIIDAYNLAGFSGPTRANGSAVVNMRKWWKSPAAASLGYVYVDYGPRQNLTQAQPGFAMFMELIPETFNETEHVAMVKSINVDQRGNGTIVTYDSNSSSIERSYDIVGWEIKNVSYPVRGFGGR